MTAGTRVRIVASFVILSVGAIAAVVVAIPTLGLARRLYTEVIARWTGWAMLKPWGIRYRIHRLAPLPARQTVYVSNHTSTLDLLLLVILGLPRTRFFLSGFARKYVPLGIIGYLMRIFWTVPQEFPEQRRQIFMRAARILKRTGDSVYLSPEGMRVTTGEIGHFNKGSFHLATDLRAPITPIYFNIPREIDPGAGFDAKSGMIDIYVLPAIDTTSWRVDDVEENRDRVRELFVRIHGSLRRHGRLPEDLYIAMPQADVAEAVLV